jgi:hypothetical protein
MEFFLSIKAFFKALKDPKAAQEFVQGQLPKLEQAKPEQDASHLRLLALLQQSGRLIDFLKEDITSFSDAQVGAAVRKIHQDCAKSLEELVTIRPVLEEREGSIVNVPQGFDPTSIKIVGHVKGEAPYKGVLIHKGWKAHKRSLPKRIGESSSDVICPAEVEIK